MTGLRTARLDKKYPFSSFFVQALVPSWLASAPHPAPGNKCIAQYEVRWPHTTHLPHYAHVFFFFTFLLRVSVPFYQVVRICRQTAAKLRMQGYHTCTLFFQIIIVSKLWYIRACKCIYAATKMRKFRHICMPHWKSRIWVPSWSVTSAGRQSSLSLVLSLG